MKRFFRKKSIFAALFLTLLLGFCVYNAAAGADTLAELAEELGGVRSEAELKEWLAGTESALSDDIQGHTFLIETYSFVQAAMGKREFDNFSFLRDDAGMLYYGAVYNGGTDDIEAYAEQLRLLREYVQSHGAELLVVLPPSKLLYGVTEVNLNWPLNDPNPRMDKLLMQLQQRRVPAVDLRLTMERSGEPLDALFFKTDHHWTPRAAFYAAQELVARIRELFGIELDPSGCYCDLNSYESVVYESAMLGSTGRNTGIPYSGLDDFEYIFLRDYEDTDFTYYDKEGDEEYRGDMKNSFLIEEKLDVEDCYDGGFYTVYAGNIKESDSIINHNKPDGIHILALRDSYFAPVACFLAPMCGQIDMHWNQHAHEVEKFVEEIAEEKHELVIVEVYPYNYNETCFTFFEEAAS